MAGLRRTQDIDQWRPEEASVRDSDRSREPERPRERINDPRPSSPAARAARDTPRRPHEADTRSLVEHAGARSRERSLSRDAVRRHSRGASKDDRYRREPSADRASHSHRHHHHHHHHRDHRDHRDTTPSSKRHRSRSASPRDSHKRVRRPRSRSPVRSRSRTRRADSTHRSSRAYSPRPLRSDRDHLSQRPSDTYVPPSSARRRSPSVDSHYRHLSHRTRKRSVSPARSSRRGLSPRRSPPRRTADRSETSVVDPHERNRRLHSSRERSRSRASRRARSPSPRRRRSPPPPRRHSPPRARGERSPRGPSRRSRSPALSSRHGSAKPSRPTSRRDSPAPASGYHSDTSNSRAEDIKMRGAYHHQGRGGPGYGHSPPYHGGRGGWNGNQYPSQGLVTNSPGTYTFFH